MAFFADIVIVVCDKAHERYFSPRPDREFAPTHISIYLLAELVVLLPVLALYLCNASIYVKPARRGVWAAGGAFAGLMLSGFAGNSATDVDQITTINARTIGLILLAALTPNNRLSWANWLMHAGFGLAVMLTRTAFAKRLDPALPQSDKDDPAVPQENEDETARPTPPDSRSHPAKVLLSSIGMLWVVASELTKVGEDYVAYFSKPLSAKKTSYNWYFGITRVLILLLYSYSTFYYIVSVKMFAWQFFCAILSGALCGIGLIIADSGAAWQYQAQDLWILVFVMHLGNIFGFFSRHTLTAHRFYKAIGIQHPAEAFEQAPSDIEENAAPFRGEKNVPSYKQDMAT